MNVGKKVVQLGAPFPKVLIDFVGEGFNVTIEIDRTNRSRKVWIRVRASTPDQYSSQFVEQDFEVCLPEYTEMEDNDGNEDRG